MKRKFFIILFIILLANWLQIILSVRVYDVTLSDRLGLFSVLPLNFKLALFALVFLALLSTYIQEYHISILFTMLFSLYFHITPWVVEPLRVIDTFYHYSRVVAVNDLGYLPTMQKYYFDFPGSTILGSSLLSITGLNDILFLKYLFPILSMFVFYLGFSVYLYRTYQDLRFVSLGLLLASIFGYGSSPFSPVGIGLMFLPLLLNLLTELRKRSYSLCFLILTIGLTISHPTTTALLLSAFLTYLILLKFIDRKIEGRIAHRTAIFAVFFFSWSMYIALGILSHIGIFFRTLTGTFFFHSHDISTRLIQPVFPIIEISIANYVFMGISTSISAVVLLRAVRSIFRRKELTRNAHRLRMLMSPCIIFVGLTFTGLCFIAAYGVFSLVSAATFAFLGTSIGIGFLNVRRKRVFFPLLVMVLLLVVPAFINKHSVEQYFIMRDPVKHGLMFTGKHVEGLDTEIICPFGSQLRAFIDFDMWDNIYSITPENYGYIHLEAKDTNFFVYRIDALYYACLQLEGSLMKEKTSYFKTYIELLNSNNFNLIYSSKGFEILANNR